MSDAKSLTVEEVHEATTKILADPLLHRFYNWSVDGCRALFAPAKEDEHEVGVLTDENATVHRLAQPAPAAVRLTPELERVLEFATYAAGTNKYARPLLLADIQTVRAQAEQAVVRLPKVREGLEELMKASRNSYWIERCKGLLAELDAVEGKVTG